MWEVRRDGDCLLCNFRDCFFYGKSGVCRKLTLSVLIFSAFAGLVNLLPIQELLEIRFIMRLLGLGIIIVFVHTCFQVSWSVAIYDSIWALMSWQLILELWIGVLSLVGDSISVVSSFAVISQVLIFIIGYLLIAVTIAKWMPDGGPKKIGPRQLTSAVLIFGAFEMVTLSSGNIEFDPVKWQILYLAQLFLALILYLQSELFKKSAMRQELEVMNLLWKKEQEQYKLSKENIALINQKCHDLKHQIRAIRNASFEDMDRYLAEMEDSIRIYESIVKTGNEVLDTILTEKSLYCKDRGITVSCVVDGIQMNFINTVDLYAILGNALDNAIEAVEKLDNQEQQQIDVLIHRQQNFLVINVINPMKERLIFEEELPVTTKGDSRFHGFGLKSVRHLVKKYDGYMSISQADGCFSLKILIPIPT